MEMVVFAIGLGSGFVLGYAVRARLSPIDIVKPQ
jgi:hypothetical protein